MSISYAHEQKLVEVAAGLVGAITAAIPAAASALAELAAQKRVANMLRLAELETNPADRRPVDDATIDALRAALDMPKTLR